MVREGLRAILEQGDGHAVVGEAGSGREAIRLAEELRPDVVVMDVAMSDLNGIEATRQITSSLPGVRVLALSSHTDRRYVNAIFAAGAHGYVLKADAYGQLARGIQAVHRGHKVLSEEITAAVVERALERGAGSSAYDLLGAREREVLQLLAEGQTSGQIAERLSVSTSTIETHRRNLMRKLDLHSVAELTKYAVREGLSSLEAAPPRS